MIPRDHHGCMFFSQAPMILWLQVQLSFITLKILEELWIQQEIMEVHINKVAYNNHPVWDAKNDAASADLIEQHFQQIWGFGRATCTNLIHEDASSATGPVAWLGTDFFNDHMIKVTQSSSSLSFWEICHPQMGSPCCACKPKILQKVMHATSRN